MDKMLWFYIVCLFIGAIVQIFLVRRMRSERIAAEERGYERGYNAGRQARWEDLYAERESAARRAQREAQTASNETRAVRRARISDAIIKPKQIWR
jgi:hypothetical protein